MKTAILASALLIGSGFAFADHHEKKSHKAMAVPVLSTQAKADVHRIMQTIEQRADNFEKHFLKDLRASTIDIEDRDRYRVWVDTLEDSLDNMQEAYREDDIAEAHEELMDAMEVASSINRFMLRADWGEESEREWAAIRDDLNKLAAAHTIPVMPVLVITATR